VKDTDTIIALSTPSGVSGLAIIRLTGPECREVARFCLGRGLSLAGDGAEALEVGAATGAESGPSPLPPLKALKPRHMHYGIFRHPATGEKLDRLNFVFYPAPHSPTGEDVLEIFPHGNPLLVESLVAAVLCLPGIRLAGPGEFTRRACENGKLDLVQAEGLMALVHAQSKAALNHAGKVLDGALSRRLKALRQKMIDLLVRLELDVDFAEEEADPDYASWRPRLVEVLGEVQALLATHARGSRLQKIPRVVLVGSPNAGKSSLINALLREERLLVSDRPGTTRDFVEVPLHLPSGLVHLIDTAGLGEAVDDLDARAQDKTRQQAAKADLRLWIEDGTLPPGDKAPGNELPGEAVTGNVYRGHLAGDVTPWLRVRTRRDCKGFQGAPGALDVANPDGGGLPELIAELDARVFGGERSGHPAEGKQDGGEDEVYLTTERQRDALQKAADRLTAALHQLDSEPAIEILAFEAREAVMALRELLGEVTADDVLHRLFAGFCIGK